MDRLQDWSIALFARVLSVVLDRIYAYPLILPVLLAGREIAEVDGIEPDEVSRPCHSGSAYQFVIFGRGDGIRLDRNEDFQAFLHFIGGQLAFP